jgi:hypothetical protein
LIIVRLCVLHFDERLFVSSRRQHLGSLNDTRGNLFVEIIKKHKNFCSYKNHWGLKEKTFQHIRNQTKIIKSFILIRLYWTKYVNFKIFALALKTF